jgi:hypothetical protein
MSTDQRALTSADQRILTELLTPPLLAAFLVVIFLTISGQNGDGVLKTIIYFPGFVCVAYWFGLIPSLLYTIVMEFWSRKGLHARCGLLCTVGLSSLLGTGAALLLHLVVQDYGFGIRIFLPLGASVGCLTGYYVGRKQPVVS